MLADGQQIAVAGIHPDTKEPFRWRNGLSPVNTSRAELPLVDEDEVRAMLDLIAEELKNKLKWVEADAAPAADANGHDTGAAYVPISEREHARRRLPFHQVRDGCSAQNRRQRSSLQVWLTWPSIVQSFRCEIDKSLLNPLRPSIDICRHYLDGLVVGYVGRRAGGR